MIGYAHNRRFITHHVAALLLPADVFEKLKREKQGPYNFAFYPWGVDDALLKSRRSAGK